MYSFNFLGKDSFSDYGIIIEKRPVIPKPQRNIDYIEVPGRSGSLRIDYETYNDNIIPIQCWFKDNDVASKADEVKAWLNSGGGRLILSNQPDRYYLAHVTDQIDFSQEWKIFSQFLINFRCQPFKYAVTNDVITLVAAGTVTNPGSTASKPIIKLYGAGSIELTINSAKITLSNITDHIIIDSVLMDAYKADNTLQNSNMAGDFPTLIAGSNTISWSGSISKIEITPNWRWL
jgi:putative phage tail component, N-terminal domain